MRATLVVLSIALAVTLSGCGEEASGERLVDTKGPTQILRNDAASRVDKSLLLSADRKTDLSEGCGLADKDPKGLMRYWHSGINLNLDTSSADSAETEGEKLVASYVRAAGRRRPSREVAAAPRSSRTRRPTRRSA